MSSKQIKKCYSFLMILSFVCIAIINLFPTSYTTLELQQNHPKELLNCSEGQLIDKSKSLVLYHFFESNEYVHDYAAAIGASILIHNKSESINFKIQKFSYLETKIYNQIKTTPKPQKALRLYSI